MGVSKAKMQMQRLIEQRDQLLAEMEALKNKIAGLEMAMALLNGDKPDLVGTEARPRRTNVKGTLLELLREAGTTGINANSAVEIASRRGLSLDRGTVSSLLSRFKRDDLVVYDGQRYRLKEFAARSERPTISVVQGGATNS